MAEAAERELITMLEGSEEAFSNLFKQFYPGLVRYASILLPYPSDEATDIVSEVFITLWNNRQDIKVRGSVSSYIYIAVKHRVYDYIKKKSWNLKNLTILDSIFRIPQNGNPISC